MKKRQPLNLVQKWLVSQYWVRQKPPLTRSGFFVLMRLLDRQNTKTGRCDPSAIGLLEKTGFSERSVRGAFKELEERGALKRNRVARRSRNQFLIYSVEELGQNQRLRALKMREHQRTDLQKSAALPAIRCRLDLQDAAPETIKETIRKRENAASELVINSVTTSRTEKITSSGIDLGEFERRVVKVFERKGFGYKGLVSLPVGCLEQAFVSYDKGITSFGQSISGLLAAYRSLQC